jgi:hypothetical protein
VGRQRWGGPVFRIVVLNLGERDESRRKRMKLGDVVRDRISGFKGVSVIPRNVVSTRKIRITRPILLDGEHAEVGEVFEVPEDTAEYLIAADCAIAQRKVPRWVLLCGAGMAAALAIGAVLAWAMARGWL